MYAHGLFILTICVYPFTTSLLAEYLDTPYVKFPVFVYCLMNAVHAASWVLLCHTALHPVDLGKSKAKSKEIAITQRSISYTVMFNVAMCILSLWLPILAVSLTALAWLVYLLMGIILTPVENEQTARNESAS